MVRRVIGVAATNGWIMYGEMHAEEEKKGTEGMSPKLTSLHVVWTEPFTRLCLWCTILVSNTAISNGIITSTINRSEFTP